MVKNRKSKRKERNSSDDSDSVNKSKAFKPRGPSEEQNVLVSDILSQANSVLYDENADTEINTSVFLAYLFDNKIPNDMAEGKEPSNKDLMIYLQGINKRLDAFEVKLGVIEELDKKVTNFEKELKSIWVALDDRTKRVEERVSKVEDKVNGTDIAMGLLADKVSHLDKERESLRDEVAYLKSQSMRNNLVFTNVPEDNASGSGPVEVTERKLRQHLQDALKIAKETAESIRFERVHRSPGHPVTGKVRSIIAKFTYFKDRDFVRKQWKELRGTAFHMYEQFPPEVIAKRKKLIPKLKEAREQKKNAWIAYDTLYVDGRPVRD